MRSWAEMRKTYVMARTEELHGTVPPTPGNWRKYRKTLAHQEFNEFVIEQQRIAVDTYKKGARHDSTNPSCHFHPDSDTQHTRH